MLPFSYQTAPDAAAAVRLGSGTGQGQTDAQAQYLAGGTTLIDLMKLQVLTPERVIDLGALKRTHSGVADGGERVRIGAFTTMAEAAEHPVVLQFLPALAQSLQQAASPQLRNMATVGGNVLQRTRCLYYRDPSFKACNKRTPGSGCAAQTGVNRNNAVLGVSPACISQYPGDLAVALAVLDAEVELVSAGGTRRLPFLELHRGSEDPHLETTLQAGEIILALNVPKTPAAARSVYVKVRDRASYAFALTSAAVALQLDGDRVHEVMIGVGGSAYRPWRAREAEAALKNQPLNAETAAAAGRLAFAGSVTHGGNDFKPALGARTVARALLAARSLEA
jgi:xanthine dehydrogenase YagS FAD-binding subunit